MYQSLAVTLLSVFGITFLGAFLQSGVGIGLNMTMMLIFPLLFSMNSSVGISVLISMASGVYLVARLWKKVQWKLIVPCALVSIAIGAFFTFYSVGWNPKIIKVLLGAMFVFLAVYSMFYSDKIHLKPTLPVGLTMGAVSGVSNGLFGIGGPPVGLYLAAAIDDNEAYVASIQGYFLLLNIMSITMRAITGAYFKGSLPVIVAGWVAAVLGTALGVPFFAKLPKNLVRMMVYGIIGVSGLVTIIQTLLS